MIFTKYTYGFIDIFLTLPYNNKHNRGADVTSYFLQKHLQCRQAEKYERSAAEVHKHCRVCVLGMCIICMSLSYVFTEHCRYYRTVFFYCPQKGMVQNEQEKNRSFRISYCTYCGNLLCSLRTCF